MRYRAFSLAIAAALAVAAGPPAHAQFFYPTIIVPPPAQNLVLPKRTPKPTTPLSKQSQPQPPDTPPPVQGSDRYQGRTLIR